MDEHMSMKGKSYKRINKRYVPVGNVNLVYNLALCFAGIQCCSIQSNDLDLNKKVLGY
uniref:Uncharacterized protein n=1 Tax=Arundo donax TaxID=35708 RepID=A0A0A9FR40_ARUDO